MTWVNKSTEHQMYTNPGQIYSIRPQSWKLTSEFRVPNADARKALLRARTPKNDDGLMTSSKLEFKNQQFARQANKQQVCL